MNDDKTFDKEYIENLAVEIKNNNHLKADETKNLKIILNCITDI